MFASSPTRNVRPKVELDEYAIKESKADETTVATGPVKNPTTDEYNGFHRLMANFARGSLDEAKAKTEPYLLGATFPGFVPPLNANPFQTYSRKQVEKILPVWKTLPGADPAAIDALDLTVFDNLLPSISYRHLTDQGKAQVGGRTYPVAHFLETLGFAYDQTTKSYLQDLAKEPDNDYWKDALNAMADEWGWTVTLE